MYEIDVRKFAVNAAERLMLQAIASGETGSLPMLLGMAADIERYLIGGHEKNNQPSAVKEAA